MISIVVLSILLLSGNSHYVKALNENFASTNQVLLIDYLKSDITTTGDGLYYTNDPDKIQKDADGNLVVSEQYYYRGLNPDNWIEFGQVSATDDTPLLWRILNLSEEGIKLIYEGAKQTDDSVP